MDPQDPRAVDDVIVLHKNRAHRLFSMLSRSYFLLKNMRELAEKIGIPVGDKVEEMTEINDHLDYLRVLLYPKR